MRVSAFLKKKKLCVLYLEIQTEGCRKIQVIIFSFFMRLHIDFLHQLCVECFFVDKTAKKCYTIYW